MGTIDQRQKIVGFFARRETHALAVSDLVNLMKTSNDPLYCVRVTADDGKLGDQYLEDFRNNEKTIPTNFDIIAEALDPVLDYLQRAQHRADAPQSISTHRIRSRSMGSRDASLRCGKDYFLTILDFVRAAGAFQRSAVGRRTA